MRSPFLCLDVASPSLARYLVVWSGGSGEKVEFWWLVLGVGALLMVVGGSMFPCTAVVWWVGMFGWVDVGSVVLVPVDAGWGVS